MEISMEISIKITKRNFIGTISWKKLSVECSSIRFESDRRILLFDKSRSRAAARLGQLDSEKSFC